MPGVRLRVRTVPESKEMATIVLGMMTYTIKARQAIISNTTVAIHHTSTIHHTNDLAENHQVNQKVEH